MVTHYEYSPLLETEDITENFANTIAVSQDGKKIAVGAPIIAPRNC